MTWTSRVLFAGVVAFIAYQLYTHREVREPGVETKADSKVVTGVSRYYACMAAATRANNFLQDGARPFLRPPVDALLWSSSETRIMNAISEGESVCSEGVTEGERYAITEIRGALAAMRRCVGELNRAQRAEGAGDLVRLQQEVESRLDRARGAMR
jgi:hypothetical protein